MSGLLCLNEGLRKEESRTVEREIRTLFSELSCALLFSINNFVSGVQGFITTFVK